MLYNYKCKKCGSKKQISIPVSELNKEEVKCDICGDTMVRDWKAGISVASNDKSDCIEETSWIKKRMNISPTGKSQIYY